MWQSFCQWVLKIFGWKLLQTEHLEVPKAIIPVVPHTSNWDFPLGILTRGAARKDIKFIAKSSLFRPPFGWLFYRLGGYPVDRSKRNNFVDSVIDIFDEKEEFLVAIAPEGTRSRVEKLKSGFYYIAKGAGIPIIPARLNFRERTVTFGPPLYPSDDQEADFARLDEFLRKGLGKNPENGYLYPTD